jgi:hypothetical protein
MELNSQEHLSGCIIVSFDAHGHLFDGPLMSAGSKSI